jgi:thioredoxin 2
MGSEPVVVACPTCSTKNRLPADVTGRPRCASCKADLPWLVNATDADFAQAVDTSQLVLVDLWAPWCGPCRMVAPVLESLAAKHAGRLKVVKVNVDDNPMTAQTYRAMSIPMLVFITDGDAVETVVGAQPEHVLQQKIDQHLT